MHDGSMTLDMEKPSMKFGTPSLIEFHSLEENVRFCSKCGLSFFEMNLTFPWFQSDKIDPSKMVALKEEYGIDYTLHFHDQLNPFDFSPELRRGSLDNVLYGIELAYKVGAKRITMHMINGTYSAVNGVKIFAYDVCEEEYLDHVREFVEVCDRMMNGLDLIYGIENTKGFMPYHKDAIELLLQNPHFGLTYDIGHNAKASEDDEAFVMKHADRVKHFHIHDVNPKANHIALGTGIIDMDRCLAMLREFDCTTVIEVKESKALFNSIEFLKSHGFSI